jgi:hypothetical protein
MRLGEELRNKGLLLCLQKDCSLAGNGAGKRAVMENVGHSLQEIV